MGYGRIGALEGAPRGPPNVNSSNSCISQAPVPTLRSVAYLGPVVESCWLLSSTTVDWLIWLWVKGPVHTPAVPKAVTSCQAPFAIGMGSLLSMAYDGSYSWYMPFVLLIRIKCDYVFSIINLYQPLVHRLLPATLLASITYNHSQPLVLPLVSSLLYIKPLVNHDWRYYQPMIGIYHVLVAMINHYSD